MAEAHPVGFQWVMEAKKRGAKVIHVDPRLGTVEECQIRAWFSIEMAPAAVNSFLMR